MNLEDDVDSQIRITNEDGSLSIYLLCAFTARPHRRLCYAKIRGLSNEKCFIFECPKLHIEKVHKRMPPLSQSFMIMVCTVIALIQKTSTNSALWPHVCVLQWPKLVLNYMYMHTSFHNTCCTTL